MGLKKHCNIKVDVVVVVEPSRESYSVELSCELRWVKSNRVTSVNLREKKSYTHCVYTSNMKKRENHKIVCKGVWVRRVCLFEPDYVCTYPMLCVYYVPCMCVCVSVSITFISHIVYAVCAFFVLSVLTVTFSFFFLFLTLSLSATLFVDFSFYISERE